MFILCCLLGDLELEQSLFCVIHLDFGELEQCLFCVVYLETWSNVYFVLLIWRLGLNVMFMHLACKSITN